MTTTAHEDQFTVGTQTIETVRQPYDTVAILRRNVADLELALRTQTERAEAAEAEMTKARKQKPVRWHVRGNYFHDGDAAILFASMNAVHGANVEQLYAAPVPVPHKGATHCDDCGLTWLDDGLNPLRCPYCKDPVPAPAVPAANPVQWLEDEGDMILVPRGLLGAACSSIDKQRPAPKVLEAMRHYTMNAPQAPAVPTNTIPEGDDFNGTTPHMIRCIESLVAMNDRGALAPHGLCGHSRTLLLASANRLRQQQAHVVPAVPGEWRETLSKLVGIVESSTKFHGCDDVTKQARALLQSAPQASAVPAEWREVMSELAADVQAACDAEHPHRDQYPSVMRKYNNDMEIVEKARALLQSAEVTK